MKQRIISGAIVVALLLAVVYLRDSLFFNVAISLMCVMGVYEVLMVTKIHNRWIMNLSVIFAASVPFISTLSSSLPFKAVAVTYVILLLLVMLRYFETLPFRDVAVAFCASLLIASGFSSLIYLRDIYIEQKDHFAKMDGLFFIILVFICSWITDTGAYFVGVFFGKHKLCPKISPKKTVEGAIGGIAICAIVSMLATFLFNQYVFKAPHLSYYWILPLSIFLSIMGMCGDLAASTIKRNYDAKDFGNIMPGHGGIMDRFDSVLFTAPILYAIVLFIPIVLKYTKHFFG